MARALFHHDDARRVQRGLAALRIGADKPARARFTKPTIEEVQAYCRERGNSVDANRFIDYYEANGWKVGKNPMSDWRAAIRTWEKNAYSTPQKAQSSVTGTLDFEAMEAYLHGGGN